MKGVKRYMEIILTVFSEKKFSFGASGPLDSKMVGSHNSGSTLRIFMKFYTMKGAKSYMELILVVFLKKFSLGANGPFWPENGT